MTPGRPRLAVAVSSQYPDLRPDWPLLRLALTDLDLVVSTEVWTDPHVPWSEFDLVVANLTAATLAGLAQDLAFIAAHGWRSDSRHRRSVRRSVGSSGMRPG